MTRANLRGRLRALEAAADRQEDPRHAYLSCLLLYIGKAREARQSGEEKKAREAHALRLRLEVLARRGEV